MSDGAVRVALLGDLTVTRDTRVVEVSGARLRTLLARMAVAGGRSVGVSSLAEDLWPDREPADSVGALQSLVSRLRRLLGPDAPIESTAAGYRLVLAPDAVDALHFTRLAADARTLLRAGDAAGAAQGLRTALALWRGPVCAEVDEHDAARLTERHLDALADRITADLATNLHADVITELEDLVREHPLREGFAAQLMTALAGSGRAAEALTVYENTRAQLVEELGVDPSAELRERHLAVLAGTIPVAAPPVPDRVADVGPGTLPAALTSFVGRGAEVALLDGLLDTARLITVLGPGGSGKTRLALQTARRRRHRDGTWFVDLAAVTDPTEVVAAVLDAIGARGSDVLDRRTGTRVVNGVERVLVVLAERDCLLVLDNVEHQVGAVAELVDTLLARCPAVRVLATSREPIGLVGESLVPLDPLPLPPDTADDIGPEAALDYDAVRLFADRAAAVRPGFRLDVDTVGPVLQIVRRLDGLPLAIELAAARLRTLPPAEIAARLTDRFRLLTGGSRVLARHRTLRAVVDWSWELLSPAERLLAERFSVFPAGATPRSVLAVCADDRLPAEDIDDLLGELVDRSLLVLVEDPLDPGPRYRMLETLRQYGDDRLVERCERTGVRARFTAMVAELARAGESGLRTGAQRRWLLLLTAEHDTLLAALRLHCEDGDRAAAARIALDLCWYWMMTDRTAEAMTWLGVVARLPGELAPAVDAQVWAAYTMTLADSPDRAHPHDVPESQRPDLAAVLERLNAVADDGAPLLALLRMVLPMSTGRLAAAPEAIASNLSHPDPWVRAMAATTSCWLAENNGDVNGARGVAEQGLAAFVALGDRWCEGFVRPWLAQQLTYDGDLDGAREHLESALTAQRELFSGMLDRVGDDPMVSLQLADVLRRLGDRDGAVLAARAAVVRAERTGVSEMAAIVYAVAGGVHRTLGDLTTARELQDLAERRRAEAPTRWFGGEHAETAVAAMAARLAVDEGDPDAAAELARTATASAIRSQDRPLQAMVTMVEAVIASRRGDHAEALRLLDETTRLRGADDPTDPDVVAIRAASPPVRG